MGGAPQPGRGAKRFSAAPPLPSAVAPLQPAPSGMTQLRGPPTGVIAVPARSQAGTWCVYIVHTCARARSLAFFHRTAHQLSRKVTWRGDASDSHSQLRVTSSSVFGPGAERAASSQMRGANEQLAQNPPTSKMPSTPRNVTLMRTTMSSLPI